MSAKPRASAVSTADTARTRRPPIRCWTALTAGFKARARRDPTITDVIVRGADRARPVTAMSPTKPANMTATDRQSNSTIRTGRLRRRTGPPGAGIGGLASAMRVAYGGMARQPPTERLRFTARSLLIAVAMLGATL